MEIYFNLSYSDICYNNRLQYELLVYVFLLLFSPVPNINSALNINVGSSTQSAG